MGARRILWRSTLPRVFLRREFHPIVESDDLNGQFGAFLAVSGTPSENVQEKEMLWLHMHAGKN